MKRNTLSYADRRQEECMQAIRRIYSEALKTALEKQKRFFQKIEDIESGKYKPPQYYVQRGTVKKWRQGFVREALRQEQVIQGIMNVLNKAGKEAAALMTPYMVDIYRYNREETIRLITDGMGKGYGVTPNFAMYDPKKIRILLEDTQPTFSKIAYRNMGKNLIIRSRLQSEFAQSVILGEGVRKMRQRVQKCTGQMIWQARRVARTEFTRIQAQARYETSEEAIEMGINVYNEWTARMVNTRDTHAEMNGQKRMPGEAFESPSGALLRYPGDPSAPAAEVINCQCQITTRVMMPNERLEGGKVVKVLPSGGNGGKISIENRIHNVFRNSDLDNGLPREGIANSVADKVDDYGRVLQRRLYGADRLAKIDYDTNDHALPHRHPTGAHKHIFNYSKRNPHGPPLPLTEEEIIQNSDIIQKGVNYFEKGRS